MDVTPALLDPFIWVHQAGNGLHHIIIDRAVCKLLDQLLRVRGGRECDCVVVQRKATLGKSLIILAGATMPARWARTTARKPSRDAVLTSTRGGQRSPGGLV